MYSGPAQGLWSTPNPFNQTPAGTLKTADNVRFTALGVIEPRRGYQVASSFGSSSSLADAMAFYGSDILLAYDLTKVSLYTDESGVFTDFSGTFAPVGDNRMRFEGAARSMFFNTSSGLWMWDGVGVSDDPVLAGNQLPITAIAQPDTADGWQTANTAVAYRWTICSKDAFGRIIEGPPSGRTILRNSMDVIASGMVRTGGTTVTVTYDVGPYTFHVGDVVTLSPGEGDFPAGAKTLTAVNNAAQTFTYAEAGANTANSYTETFSIATSGSLTFPILVGSNYIVTTSNFLRLYRSDMTAAATDTPSDELYQCYETGYITAAQLSAGEVVVLDTAPEGSFDVPLYTNFNVEGALQANYQPPNALDIVYWAQRMWFANTYYRDSATFDLIGTGSPDGLQIGDIFEIHYDSGQVATWTAAAVAGGTDFELFTDADPGYNVERTARSLCAQINSTPGQDTFIAYYVSSEGGVPGKILISSVFFDVPFTLFSDRPTAWTPQLPDPSSPLWPAPASDTNTHPAGLSWSRLGQPEAVPLVNKLLVNSDNDAILRIFPLHYRLLIFKTDGIYTCTNVEPFSIQKLSAFVLLAPDSVCVLEDRVYALTDQGIITISDAGVVEISNPIDDIFNAMTAMADVSTLAARSFGMAYRSERQALLWTPEMVDGSITDDTNQAFVYSTLAQGFTRYVFGARCGAIHPTQGNLFFAPTDDNALCQENKTLTDLDYFDTFLTVTVSGSSGSDVTLSSAAGVEAGDVIQRSSARYVVESVSGNVVTVVGTPAFTSGTAFVFKAIPTEVEFNKLTAGAPADLKMVGQVSLLFRENGIHDMEATFSTEIQTDPETVTLTATGWGEFAWGGVPYGSPCRQLVRVEPLPPQTAQCAQLSVGFTTNQALAKFAFLGVDVVEAEDTKVNRP